MSFYNQQHFQQSLQDNVKSKEQMQIKEDAPLLSQVTTPERRLLKKLADIPEATPGPNAFAQQAERMQRHRLESNAFYQQEVQRRMATPPVLTHPALRRRSASDPPTPPRDSYCTTMSPFLHAGEAKENSPPLKLIPSNDYLAEPTQRAFIEEDREKFVHTRSGSRENRTPVFTSTSTFAQSAQTPSKRGEKHKEVTIVDPPAKTPKRSILEKLRLNTNFRSSTNSSSNAAVSVRPDADVKDPMPVKARAVLGTSPTKKSRASFGSSPSKSNLPRSPSKRKGLFSRKASGLAESIVTRPKSAFSNRSVESDRPPRTASTVTKTPPTAYSDPTHYSFSSKSVGYTAQTPFGKTAYQEADTNRCAIARSQSLKYFDHAIPPTPPTKDTPPDEKARRDAELGRKSSRLPFHDDQATPSARSTGIIATSDRFSPTKFGDYGRREIPALVTKPSVYSLHASVVPNMTEAATFEQMKARLDGLGLEGFSLPPENMRGQKRGTFYSPSIYSTEWGARPSSAFECHTPPTQQAFQHTKSASDESKGSSKGGEIPVIYPELAKDPSYSDITPSAAAVFKSNNGRGRDHLDVKIPWHGHTHSRDHSGESRHSRNSSIFAHHVNEDLEKHVRASPTSFSHPSATPSPLHTLPATTYEPPPRQSSRCPLGPAEELDDVLSSIRDEMRASNARLMERLAAVEHLQRAFIKRASTTEAHEA